MVSGKEVQTSQRRSLAMPNEASPTQNIRGKTTALIGLGAVSALGYCLLLWLSRQFAADTPDIEKPTLQMLGIYGALFACYWIALWLAVRLPSSRWLVCGIFSAACLFRAITLPSIPMHEIDIYRYIWDGAVLAEGVSPYRYAPQQVVEATNAGGVDHDAVLQSLVQLQATSESLGDSLYQIHYGQYPSPYPMVSQAVFALSAKLTPDSASRHTRLVIMKSLLVLMDLATLVTVMLLLREVGMHQGWSLAYGWCPLLIKEIANGGHLDSIAIFLTTLAIWLLVKSLKSPSRQYTRAALTGCMLALAIGAKLYPVILMPLFAAIWLRRQGWKTMCVGLAAAAILSAVLLYPLFGFPKSLPSEQPAQAKATSNAAGQLNTPEPSAPPQVDSDEGIQAFFDHWEMNDLIFMVVLENLRPQAGIEPMHKPWFVFTTDNWSRNITTQWVNLKQNLSPTDGAAEPTEPLSDRNLRVAAFSLARVLTGSVFFLVACWLAWSAAGTSDPKAWCRAAMLTLAWFWLTCPTQNPWYWCWALPFLPFATSRTWCVVSAVTLLYYLRFWLSAHYPEPPIFGTPYNGTSFFYFVIAWIESAPVLLALAIESFLRRKNVSD